MCGIITIFDNEIPPQISEITACRDTMTYRGPDGSDAVVFEDDHIAMGHRRLSILDPTPAGAQPMTDKQRDLTIVHNGEVYNYIELRKTLEKTGYSFKTGTDTEVIIAAYDKWRDRCVRRFNGMFSFAIWDSKRKELFAARDRLGIKPLYYYFDGKRFILASEIKAILSALISKPSVDISLIDYYMSFGYVPGEDTLLKGIKRLLPGHYIVFDKKKLIHKRYWDLSFANTHDHGSQYYIEELRRLLNSSIDFRLRSDVPLGIFLSGGIDSSAVVALLAPRVSERLKTFSVAYDFGADYNETNYARIVARQFNTDHHEFVVTPGEFKDFIPRYVYHMDEPVTESAAISLYYIAKMAKNYVTVVLSGEGSDELFAGYDFYYYNCIIENYRQALGNKGAAYVIRALCSVLPDNKIKKYLRMSLLPLESRYKGISTYDEQQKEILYSSAFRNHLRDNNDNATSEFIHNLFTKTKHNDALSKMLYFDTKTWLVDDLLIKADRMSMAASLELRVPFLDHRIVEFAATIPSKYKLNGRTTKHVLKQMLKGVLPQEIVYRKKMGFPTPLKIMFQNELADYAHDVLTSTSAKIGEFFVTEEIRRLLREHVTKVRDNHRIIWQLVVLETCLQLYASPK